MKLFVPFSEAVIERHGFSFAELVPFNAEYACWRSFDTETSDASPEPPRDTPELKARAPRDLR